MGPKLWNKKKRKWNGGYGLTYVAFNKLGGGKNLCPSRAFLNCEGEGELFLERRHNENEWLGRDSGGNKWADPRLFNKTNPNLFKTKIGSHN